MQGLTAIPLERACELDIGVLYAEHAPFVARVLTRLTGSGAHVDDLLQETFVVAFRKRASFAGRSTPRTWIYGIAVRLGLRHGRGLGRFARLRARLYREPAPPPHPAPDQDCDRERKRAALYGALQKLPFKQREVFVLYELEELECPEIASLLEIPVGTVWTRLHHARRKFRKLIGKYVEQNND